MRTLLSDACMLTQKLASWHAYFKHYTNHRKQQETTNNKERNIMARVTTCRFCNRTSINHDHDTCAENFGTRLKGRILAWSITHPDKPLPQRLRAELGSQKWSYYQEYLGRLKEEAEVRRKACTYADRIRRELQRIGQAKMQRMNSGYQVQVSVSVKCTPVPRY